MEYYKALAEHSSEPCWEYDDAERQRQIQNVQRRGANVHGEQSLTRSIMVATYMSVSRKYRHCMWPSKGMEVETAKDAENSLM
jgi:hypothetical protein